MIDHNNELDFRLIEKKFWWGVSYKERMQSVLKRITLADMWEKIMVAEMIIRRLL